MEDLPSEERFMSPKHALSIFALQMNTFPDLLDEVYELSGGSPGIATAIMATMGEKISLEPDVQVTPQFIRDTLFVPEDTVDLGLWRENFLGSFKARSENQN